MKNKNVADNTRRSLIKGFFIAGAAALAGTATAEQKAYDSKKSVNNMDDQEILYRETEEFRSYYNSLLD